MPVVQAGDLQAELGQAIAEQCVAIRQRRRLVEERWLRSRRVWMGLNYEQRYQSSDTSPAAYTIPAARRAAERTIIRAIKLLTPNAKWFKALPMGLDVDRPNISMVAAFFWQLLRNRI